MNQTKQTPSFNPLHPFQEQQQRVNFFRVKLSLLQSQIDILGLMLGKDHPKVMQAQRQQDLMEQELDDVQNQIDLATGKKHPPLSHIDYGSLLVKVCEQENEAPRK